MMARNNIDWLLTTPIAHRGLHQSNITENSVEAIGNSIESGFPIEIDVHLCQKETMVVFHDDNLTRLLDINVKTQDLNPELIKYLKYSTHQSSIMTLNECLAIVNGQVPLLIELKNTRILRREIIKSVLSALDNYQGQYAIQSFDPLILKSIRGCNQEIPLGWLCCNWWQQNIGFFDKVYLNYLGPYLSKKIDFLCIEKNLLKTNRIKLLRQLFRKPIIAWTIDQKAEYQELSKYCDNIIFEGFLP